MKNIIFIILAALLFASFSMVDETMERKSEPAYKPGPEVLQSYTGTYTSYELETFYTLELRDSTLVVLFLNGQVSKLDVLNVDLFKGDVYFLTEMKFIRNGEGKLSGFEVSNEHKKGVLFLKDRSPLGKLTDG
jgi:hypothetical protein